MKYKKFTGALVTVIILAVSFAFTVNANAVVSDSFDHYKEKYEKYISEYPDTKISFEEFFKADDTAQVSGTSSDNYLDEFYYSLPDDIKKQLPSWDKDGPSPNSFGFDFFVDKIKAAVKELFPSYKSSLLSILGILMVSAVSAKLSENASQGSRQALGIVSAAAIAVCILNTGVLETSRIKIFIDSISGISTAVLPVITALLASTGNLTSAALVGQSLVTVCTVLEFVFSKAALPLLTASTGLTIVSGAVGIDEGYQISAFFRKLSTFITVFSMSFLVFVIAVRSTLASAADGIGMKTIKFAVGNFVPFVGGTVSETINTVGAGFVYIKNTCGALSLVVLFILTVPPLIALALGKLVFYSGMSAGRLLGCTAEAKMFSELSEIMNSLIALLVSASVVFVYILIFVISCGVRIGGG